MTTKTCSTCNETLPATAFYKDKRNRDGLYSECKSCTCARRQTTDAPKRRAATNARRAADPEAARAKDAAYYQAHKAARAESQRRYRAKRKAEELALEGDG